MTIRKEEPESLCIIAGYYYLGCSDSAIVLLGYYGAEIEHDLTQSPFFKGILFQEGFFDFCTTEQYRNYLDDYLWKCGSECDDYSG